MSKKAHTSDAQRDSLSEKPGQDEMSLDDRYTIEKGRVLLSGIQALVRLPMDQMRRDRKRNLTTGIFISGYRGSPLGGYDTQLHRLQPLLETYDIKFQPGVNEELAATSVWGSQQLNLFEGARVDGVCGIWYGKTPGVDRSTDAFRHANAAGSAKHGGVLVVAGDDHGSKSSTYPGQSEFAFVDMNMPVLNPSNVQEVLDFGLYGVELSRFSGCWVAMITLTENMDSAATVEVDSERLQLQYPDDVVMPEGGLNIRVPDTPLEQEERLWRYKRPAALSFARKNNINKLVLDNADATLGIVTTGKAHLDLMQALEDLGLDLDKARALGIRILKVGMSFPLDIADIHEFARDIDCLFVVEEKRSLIETQLKEQLYNIDSRLPKIVGKFDNNEEPLLPPYGELSPLLVGKALLRLLPNCYGDSSIVARSNEAGDDEGAVSTGVATQRTPFFCSGCPHNTSTKVPEGSVALAGIGCHYLAQSMNRSTYTFTQMGGEGTSWIGQSHFTDTPHVFVNIGDGTYFHSGILAIRAAVAAGVNITYKVLYNAAVAMTGGQPHDGELRIDMLASQILAEGVKHLVLVVEDVKKYQGVLTFPPQVEIRHRDDMDAIQRELRTEKGVTCIIYDQMCATELRRKRKRSLVADPQRWAIINDLVCEGCGDCSAESNCISIEPKVTEFGTKRQINQNSCNRDLSCIRGFCPSFVTVEGGRLRKPGRTEVDFMTLGESMPAPTMPNLSSPWGLLVTGVGGTGVVTVGALIAMAAYIEGKAVTTLDQTGLAQKNGAVYSHIRVAERNEQLHAVRISDSSADALIACDLVAASAESASLSKLNHEKTHAIVNTNVLPTSAFVLGGETPDEQQKMLNLVEQHSAQSSLVDGHGLTHAALGTTTTSNIFLLGYAYQKGCIPVGHHALYKAIELNGVAIEENLNALNAGRLAAGDFSSLQQHTGLRTDEQTEGESFEELLSRRKAYLTDYQNAEYASRYVDLVEKVSRIERSVSPDSDNLSKTVARYAFKLMAYKDEYEVARLYTSGEFETQLRDTFEGDYKLKFNLAPPLLTSTDPHTGVHKKMVFGGWMYSCFKLLAKLKFLRATPLDLFGYTAERKQERDLIERYVATVGQLVAHLNIDNLELACRIAALPDQIRGYGHIKAQCFKEVDGQWQRMLEAFCRGESDFTHAESTTNAVRTVEV